MLNLRVINIVDSVDALNYGVWNAAINNASQLLAQGFETELWYPETEGFNIQKVACVPIKSSSISALRVLVKQRELNPHTDVIVTHGIWQFCSKWGHYLHNIGYRWIYVPQGMLEPWPLRQKWLKKKIYFHFVEKRLAESADVIRAVSKPELHNLKQKFQGKRIEFLPNAVDAQYSAPRTHIVGNNQIKRYLFLSRLHHKKNVLGLAQAWLQSSLNNESAFELIIAGPDQGELEQLKSMIGSSSNLTYVGAVFGEEKKALLRQCTFYVLPSFSEGLPSALLEAMAEGLVPIITEGCNFPDVFENQLGAKITTDMRSIKDALETTARWGSGEIRDKSERSRALIVEQYSFEALTKKQIEVCFDTVSSMQSSFRSNDNINIFQFCQHTIGKTRN